MNEKDIFSVVDNISEDNLGMIMDKSYTMNHIENPLTDYNEKERIRLKIRKKVDMDKNQQDLPEQTITINKVFSKVIKSVVAAMFVFIVSVNVFPGLVLAFDNIPVLNKLVKAVSFDKGFKNVIDNGNIQEVNTTSEDKGIKLTVTTIAGDDLKLWIGYELKGKSSILGQIVKFKNKTDGKELPWVGFTPEGKNYIEVHMDKLVKNFKMEVEIYKDDPSFHIPLSQLNEKAISDMQQLFEISKITTLSIPLTLNDKIYNKGLRVINVECKEFKSNIGTFKVEKLELTESRRRVYCKLVSEENELVDVILPRLIDEQGKNYSSPNDFTSRIDNNTLCLELSGGIKNIEGLSFTCNGIKYINKKDKFVTVDLKNKRMEPNNLGISLINIDSSNISLNVAKNAVEFGFEAKNENGNKVEIKEVQTDSSTEVVKFKFNELKADKITLRVNSVQYSTPIGFSMKLTD